MGDMSHDFSEPLNNYASDATRRQTRQRAKEIAVSIPSTQYFPLSPLLFLFNCFGLESLDAESISSVLISSNFELWDWKATQFR